MFEERQAHSNVEVLHYEDNFEISQSKNKSNPRIILKSSDSESQSEDGRHLEFPSLV